MVHVLDTERRVGTLQGCHGGLHGADGGGDDGGGSAEGRAELYPILDAADSLAGELTLNGEAKRSSRRETTTRAKHVEFSVLNSWTTGHKKGSGGVLHFRGWDMANPCPGPRSRQRYTSRENMR